MLPATIAPRIATATIAQLGRLFDGSAADILSELLEHSRQAGASRIAITTTGAPGDQLLNIVDDGRGIADPASIVTPTNFGQPDRVRFRKAPAGIGVLSLAGRDVLIRSWSKTERQGWMAHIPASAWQGSRAIAICADPIAHGTSITVRMPEDWATELRTTIVELARHYPLPVSFNGDDMARALLLAGVA